MPQATGWPTPKKRIAQALQDSEGLRFYRSNIFAEVSATLKSFDASFDCLVETSLSPPPMIPWLPQQPIFPPVESALKEPDGPNGLLAAGGDLSPERLLAAYRQGIFPWSSEGEPLLWWSPDPRMVLFPKELRISRSFARVLKKHHYEVRLDTSFARVMTECAAPRRGQPGTWITEEMQAGYLRLHELGYAHSVETWVGNELVGGLYGVAIGRAFYGESMFARMSDASKIALAHLCRYLAQRDFAVIDCQMTTAHLASLGGREISRQEFVAGLAVWTKQGIPPSRWSPDAANNLFRQALET